MEPWASPDVLLVCMLALMLTGVGSHQIYMGARCPPALTHGSWCFEHHAQCQWPKCSPLRTAGGAKLPLSDEQPGAVPTYSLGRVGGAYQLQHGSLCSCTEMAASLSNEREDVAHGI